MRPTTDLGALAAAIHCDTYEDHDTPCNLTGCRLAWRQDVDLAQRLISELGRLGFHVAPDVSLSTTAPSGKRETSRKAAASIADLSGGMKGVYELVACNGTHGLTDEQINEQYPGFAKANGFPPVAADSPRKRRQSLTDARYLVDSGRRRATRSGNEAIVWVVRTESVAVAA